MPKKPQPAQRSLFYDIPSGAAVNTYYLDLARDLSIVNRRLYEQGKQYFVESIEFGYNANPATVNQIWVSASTAGDTWVVHNTHKKAKALHKQMQKLVLKDNPSIKGTWADFKVYLDDGHKTGTTLPVLDGSAFPVKPGEWEYSTFVMPQHEVDPATGEPLAALEYQGHLLGPDTGTVTGSTIGLVKAYAQSRATVQPIDPAVPATMSTSFFNLLTDSGSQEPELADVIEDENDEPPYDQNEYPGGGTNAPRPWIQDMAIATEGSPNAVLGAFTAECGLVKIVYNGALNGDPATPPGGWMRVNLMIGNYKGVAALPMGQ